MTQAEGTTQTIVTPQVAEPGDHEKFAHFVDARKLADATINGTALQALCGKTWVPTRDPKKFPICPECKALWETSKVDDSNPDYSGM